LAVMDPERGKDTLRALETSDGAGFKQILHLHGVISRADYSTLGGHISKMIANMTVEVFIHKLNERLERKHDPETGLNLLD